MSDLWLLVGKTDYRTHQSAPGLPEFDRPNQSIRDSIGWQKVSELPEGTEDMDLTVLMLGIILN